MYYMVHSSKGVSSVSMGRWLGITQKAAWTLSHAIREMMDMSHENFPAVGGVVEIDEKFLGGRHTDPIAAKYAGHSFDNHGDDEFERGEVHNNTAESFNALLERAKNGVFLWISKEHMKRYINAIAFRWNHSEVREEPERQNRNGATSGANSVEVAPRRIPSER